ncbi:MAG TPA: S8 family serine peptidase [Solirubrobacterales bacterium]|nr:S8 family serine peptidase [Solirubrobacterales bacterium]
MRAGKHLSRRLGFVLALALACVCAAAPAVAGAPAEPRAAALSEIGRVGDVYVAGEALVRFEPGTSSAERRSARRAAGVELDDALALPRAEVLEVDGSVVAAIQQLERQPSVAYAQPNYRYEALGVPPPNDTFFEPELWGLSDPAKPDPGVSALEAWESNKGAGEVIAVLDTGIDLTHPDLEGNLWTNELEDLGLEGVDEDLNGQTDDVHGYDFVDDDGDPDDYQFHGTHVAGTAAAIDENNLGVAGVAPEAELMAVRVLDGDGSGTTKEITEGIVYAAENGADVINMSLGGSAGNDQATEDAIDLAGIENAVVVAAAGNQGVDNDVSPHVPCSLPQPNLICVAALNQSGALAGFSNHGVESVDVAAPGTSILSAKTDYGPPLFEDGFEFEFATVWDTEAFDGGIPWDLSPVAASGTQSATDSPGGDYGQSPDSSTTAESNLFTATATDLTGERGCRVHFRAIYEIEKSFDTFFAGAFSEEPSVDGISLDGTSPGFPSSFAREEASISDLDDRNDVRPLFSILSDEEVQRDGAYVDDVRLICRDETYVDAEVPVSLYDQPAVGNYVRFQGTSMATPHVSGVAALVRAAAPSLNAVQVVDAIRTGASKIPNPSATRHIATEGIADACQAIAVATGTDFAVECPGSSENVPFQPPTENPPPPPGPSPPLPQPPVVDRDPPSTFFEQRPPKAVRTATNRARVVFRFGSDEAGATFVCSIDGKPYRSCGRRLVRRFALGAHVLRVVARDAAGNVDRSPAVYRFRVERRR